MSYSRQRRRILSPATRLQGVAPPPTPVGPIDPRLLMSSGLRDTMRAEEDAYNQRDQDQAYLAQQQAREQERADKAAEAAQKKAEAQSQKMSAYAKSKEYDAAGINSEMDALGNVVAKKDAMTGKTDYRDMQAPVQYPETGKPYQMKRGEDGKMKQEFPDAKAAFGNNPNDPTDPAIYRQNKAAPWDRIDPQEGLLSPEPEVKRESSRRLLDDERKALQRESEGLGIEMRNPDNKLPSPEKLAEMRARAGSEYADPKEAETLKRADERDAKLRRQNEIATRNLALETTSPDDYAAERLAKLDPKTVQAKRADLMTQKSAGIDAIKAKFEEEQAALQADYQAFLPQTQGFRADQEAGIREKMGQFRLRKQMLDAKRQSLEQSVTEFNAWGKDIHQQSTQSQKERQAKPLNEAIAELKPPTKPVEQPADFQGPPVPAKAQTWPEMVKQERESLAAMEADPSMKETAAVKRKWLEAMEKAAPTAEPSALASAMIAGANTQSYPELEAARKKDFAAGEKMRNEAKATHDAYEATQRAAMRLPTRSPYVAPEVSPETLAEVNTHRAANFLGQYQDAPSNYAPWGELTINPTLFFKDDAYKAAVDGATAPAHAKQNAMAQLPVLQQGLAAPVFEAFLTAGGTDGSFRESLQNTIGKLGSYRPLPNRGAGGDDMAAITAGWPAEDKVLAVKDFMASPGYSPNWNQIALGVSGGADAMQQQYYGMKAYLGIDQAGSQKAGEEEMRQQEIQGAARQMIGGSQPLGALTQGAMSLFPSIAAGIVSGGTMALVGGSAAAVSSAALAGGSLGAGMQSAGSTMIEATKGIARKEANARSIDGIDPTPGAPISNAGLMEARVLSTVSGAITATLTRLGGATGSEAIFGAMFGGATKAAVLPAVQRTFVQKVIKGAGDFTYHGAREALMEELPDQLAQNVLAQNTFNPDRDLKEGLWETTWVSFLLGGGMNAVTEGAGAIKEKFNGAKLTEKYAQAVTLGQGVAMAQSPDIITDALAGSPLEARTPEVLSTLAEIDARIVDGMAELDKATTPAAKLYSNKQLAFAYAEREAAVVALKKELNAARLTAAMEEIDAALPPEEEATPGMSTLPTANEKAFAEDKRRAKGLIKIAAGQEQSLDEDELNLLGLARDDKGKLIEATFTSDASGVTIRSGSRVKIEDGKLVIRQGTIDRMVALFPKTEPLIGKTEGQQRAEIQAKVAAEQAAKAAPQKDTKTDVPTAEKPQPVQGEAAKPAPVGTKNAPEQSKGTPEELAKTAREQAAEWDRANKMHRGTAWHAGGTLSGVDEEGFTGGAQGFADAQKNGGDNLGAHGMSKAGTLSGALDALVGMLTNGLDPNRNGGELFTASLTAQKGGGGTTAGGFAYRDGPFILVQRPGTGAMEGNLDMVGAVLVNEAHAHLVPALRDAIQAIRPDITVDSYSNAGKVTADLHAGKAAPAPAPAPAAPPATGKQTFAVEVEGLADPVMMDAANAEEAKDLAFAAFPGKIINGVKATGPAPKPDAAPANPPANARWDTAGPADQPSPNLPPKATENAPPRPVRGDMSRQDFVAASDAWDDKYMATHNWDGTPIQPTVLHEVARKVLAALKDKTYDERLDSIGTDIGAEMGTGLRQLINDGWVWDDKTGKMVDPQNRGQTPYQALQRIRGHDKSDPKAPAAETAPEVPQNETPAPDTAAPPLEIKAISLDTRRASAKDLTPLAIFKGVTKAAGKRGAKHAKKIKAAAESLSKEIKKWERVFEAGVLINNSETSPVTGGGVQIIGTKQVALVIDFKTLAESLTTPGADTSAWASRAVLEEAIHAVVMMLDSSGQIDLARLWADVPAKMKEDTKEFYPYISDSGNQAHEYFRAWLQHRMDILDGKPGNPIFTEDTFPPSVKKRFEAVIERLVSYFRDMATALRQAGASKDSIDRLMAGGDLMEKVLLGFRAETAPTNSVGKVKAVSEDLTAPTAPETPAASITPENREALKQVAKMFNPDGNGTQEGRGYATQILDGLRIIDAGEMAGGMERLRGVATNARPQYPTAADDLDDTLNKMEGAANAEAEEAAPDPIRDLILSDESRLKKAMAMKKLSVERGETVKQTQEYIESRLVQIADEIARGDGTPEEKYAELVRIYDQQPLFSSRTSTSMENQAYSTPIPMAYALGHMTGVTPQTSVYDGTAGNGVLAIGADLENSVANEIDSTRRQGLESMGIGTITDKDATLAGAFPSNHAKVDVVHLNPPFGTIPNVNYQGYGMRKLEHIITVRALEEAMKADGTAAIIMGATMNSQEQSKGAQWVFENYLYGNYNVVDNFEVTGDLYGNQGAKWPVRILVLAGKRTNPVKAELAPKTVDRLNTWPEVWERAQRTRYEVERQRQTLGTEGQSPVSPDSPEGATQPENEGAIPGGKRGSSGKAPKRGRSGGNRPGKPDPAKQPGVGSPAVAPPGLVQQPQDSTPASEPPVGGGKPAPRMEGGSGGRPDGSGGRPGDSTRGGGATGSGNGTPQNAGGLTPAQIRLKALAARLDSGGNISSAPIEQAYSRDIPRSEAAELRDIAESLLFDDGIDTPALLAETLQALGLQNLSENVWSGIRALKASLPATVDWSGTYRSLKPNKPPEKPDAPRKKATATETQIPYDPESNGAPFETLIPRGIGEAVRAALEEITANRGPIDEYVAGELDMSVEDLLKAMSAEQVDGVAMAIYQMETGGALIIGDETGIGKGRQAASLIRYAVRKGKIPVFFTKDPKLFSDMWGDLQDINTPMSGPNASATDLSVRPLIFGAQDTARIVTPEGALVLKPATLPQQRSIFARTRTDGFAQQGYNAIFTTYSQIRKENDRQAFLEWLAENDDVVIVLDEAHEAAGNADSSMQAAFMMGGTVTKGSGPEKVETTKSGLLNGKGAMHPRGGALYLSATFAKRPDNMPVYFRTDLRKAGEGIGQVVDAMSNGGVALQQAVTEALAEAGQYIRRERDFTGVSYSMKRVQVDDEADLVRQVDEVTEVLSAISNFSSTISASVAASTALSDNQQAMTEFASIVHNQVGQLLLAAKADAVVAEVLAAKERGEKPIVALMNTMESFLSQYIGDMEINVGDAVQLSWSELLQYALSRTLRVSEKMPDGSTQISTVDPEEFGLGRYYQRVMDSAKDIQVTFPVSPIDYIIQKAELAGVKMGELTGRQSGIQYTDFTTGAGTYKTFKKANKNTLVNGFNGGALDAMLLNASGSTGLSIHASEKFKDQQPRHMIIAQPALDINVFIQTLGRIKRTGIVMKGQYPDGSAYGARYSHLTLPLNAELRPAVMAARKMKSLNANTTGESDSAVKIEAEDLMNRFGNRAVAEYLNRNPELASALNLEIDENKDGEVTVPAEVARQFTGRMSLRPDAEQGAAYAEIIADYRRAIEQAKVTGDYDLEIIVHDDWDGVQLNAGEQIITGTDESSILTASVYVQPWEITDNRPTPSGAEMLREFQKENGSVDAAQTKWEQFAKKVDDRLNKMVADQTQNLADAAEMLAEMQEDDAGYKGQQFTVNQLTRNLATTNKKMEIWGATKLRMDEIIDRVGQVVQIEQTETNELDQGMLTQIKYPDLSKGLRIAPSAFKFTYLLDRPGGRIYPSLAQFRPKGYSQSSSNYTIDELKGDRGGKRQTRTIIVGNPVRAYAATGGKGKVVRFKSRDGELVTGLMMPRNWRIKQLVDDPRMELTGGASVARYFANMGYSNGYLESGENIRLQKGGFYKISAPVSRRTGKAIFFDKRLIELAGEFTKTGNRMVATFYDAANVAMIADRITEITGKRLRGQDMSLVQKANGVDVDGSNATGSKRRPKSAVKEAATKAWTDYIEGSDSTDIQSQPVDALSALSDDAPISDIAKADPVAMRRLMEAYTEGQTFSDWKGILKKITPRLERFAETIWRNLRNLTVAIVVAATATTTSNVNGISLREVKSLSPENLRAVAAVTPAQDFFRIPPGVFDEVGIGPVQSTQQPKAKAPTPPAARPANLQQRTNSETAGYEVAQAVFLPKDIQQQWLDDGFSTKALTVAAEFMGQKEGQNAILAKIFNHYGITESQDSYPWCATFTSFALTKGGRPAKIFNARGFMEVGTAAKTPVRGDVVVLWNENPKTGGKKGWGGHVGLYLGETPTHVIAISGNAGDEVNVSAFHKERVLGIRRVAPKTATIQSQSPADLLRQAKEANNVTSESGISRVSNKKDHLRVGTASLGTDKKPVFTPKTSNISGALVPEDLLERQMAAVNAKNYPHLPQAMLAAPAAKKRRMMIDWIKLNLKALHDAFPAEYRARATHWYDGANRIAQSMARRYSTSVSQAAGVIAVFSPQKDWFRNVTQAQQFMSVWNNDQDTRIAGVTYAIELEHIINAAQATGTKLRKEFEGETAKQKADRQAYNESLNQQAKDDRRELLDLMRGKTVAELDDTPHLQAWAIRTIAQVKFGRHYQNLSPEGDVIGIATKLDGEPSTNMWGSGEEIEKAVRIMKDGSRENISNNLGQEHKVRNFYNNIIAPNSGFGDATIDTHAVAAAHLMPYGSSAAPVAHNFGTGISKSDVSGVSGLYHLYLDAYREAAAELGIQPRQLQSITWEAIRLLFPKAIKNKQTLADVTSTWQDMPDGNARKKIISRGIPSPVWAGTNNGGKSGRLPGRDSTRDGTGSGSGAGLRAGSGSAGGSGRGGIGRNPAGTIQSQSPADLLAQAQDVRIAELQRSIDAKYESGKLRGIGDLEAELEGLLDRAESDREALDESDPADFEIDSGDAASPDAASFLIDALARWNKEDAGKYSTFGAFARRLTGDNEYVIDAGATDAEIEEAAKDATAEYERRRAAMRNVRMMGITDVVQAIRDGNTDTPLRAVNQVIEDAAALRDRVRAESKRRAQPRQTGKPAIMDQIVRGMKSGKLDAPTAKAIIRFINGLADSTVEDTALSMRSGKGTSSFDFGEALTTLFFNQSNDAAQTAIHEFWHGLSRFLPTQEVAKMRKDYQAALAKYLVKNPGFFALVGRYALLPDQFEDYSRMATPTELAQLQGYNARGNKVPHFSPDADHYKISFTKENYRYVMLDEWIAETMADLVMADQPVAEGFMGQMAAIFRKFWSAMKVALGRDPYERFRQAVMGPDARQQMWRNTPVEKARALWQSEKVATPFNQRFSAIYSQSPADLLAQANVSMAEVDALAATASAESDGDRTIGDPTRAGGAGTGVESDLNDVMLAASNIYADDIKEMAPQKLADLDAVVRGAMEADPEGNLTRLIRDGMQKVSGNAFDVRMRQMLKEWLARQPATPERREQAAALTMGDHLAKRTASQILGASRDMWITKTERFRAFMMDHIYTPPPVVRKQIENAATLAEREALIKKDQERIHRIIDALAKMGVTIEDVLNGGRKLLARRGEMNRTTLKDMDAKKMAAAMDTMDATHSFKDIAAKHGMTVEQAKAAKAEAMAKVMEELRNRRKMAQRAQGIISSQPVGDDPWVTMDFENMAKMSDADAEVEMERIMKELGWFDDAQQGKRRTTKRRVPKTPPAGDGSAKGPRKSIPQPELELEIVSIFHGMDVGNQVDVVRMKHIVDTASGGGLDMLREIYINFLLSGPVTQATNIVGNVAFGTYNLVFVRAAESMVNALTGNQLKDTATFTEFVHIFKAAMPALIRGAKMAHLAWGSEHDFFESIALGDAVGMGGTGLENLGGRKAISERPLGKLSDIGGKLNPFRGRVIRMPGRSLLAADSGLKSFFGTMEVAAHAYRLTRKEGIAPGTKEFDASMNRLMYIAGSPAWDAAVKQAELNAFQQALDESKNPIDWFPRWIMKASQSNNPFAKLFGTAFFPFVKTPYNIAKTAVVNSPLGTGYLLYLIGKGGLASFKGGKLTFAGEPEFVTTVARQILAWTAYFALQAISEGDKDDDKKKYLITGSPPKNRGEADLQKRALGGAYMIRLGGVSMNYGRLEPFATVVASTVDVLRSIKRGDSSKEAVTNLVTSLSYQAQNKTFLTGLASIGDILEGRTYGKDVSDIVLQKVISSAIPNLVKQPMRNWADTEMDTKDAPWWHSAFPLPSAVGTKLDPATGEEKLRTGNSATRMLMPSSSVPDQKLTLSDKVLLEWNRLRQNDGSNDEEGNPGKAWAPKLPSPTRKLPNQQDIELNEFARNYLVKRRAVLAQKALAGMPLKPDQTSIDLIKKAYSDGSSQAWNEIKYRPSATLGTIKK